jgi:hypothetical protein
MRKVLEKVRKLPSIYGWVGIGFKKATDRAENHVSLAKESATARSSSLAIQRKRIHDQLLAGPHA